MEKEEPEVKIRDALLSIYELFFFRLRRMNGFSPFVICLL